MGIKYHTDLIQGSDEWLAARCGMLTASETKLILTPSLKPARNDKERNHLYELLAQRITKYVEPHYVSDDMLRGQEDEVEARILYDTYYGKVQDVGFITNDEFGFNIGFSPDGLIGDDGFLECKSRRQKFQVETIIEGAMPFDYMLQVQTGYLVSGRRYCDFVSYSGGLPMVTIHVPPDYEMQDAIVAAATDFEARLLNAMERYHQAMHSDRRLIPTERRKEIEIVL